MKPEEDPLLAVAEKLASSLFVNGAGQQADRLVLTIDPTTRNHESQDLGGLCMEAVRDRVLEVLRTVRREALRENFRVTERPESRRWSVWIEFSDWELQYARMPIEDLAKEKIAGLPKALREAFEARKGGAK